jgi:hypothetical protein
LRVERDEKFSAAGSPLEIGDVRFIELRRGEMAQHVVANAPVLFARRNTIGKFSDVPLLVYCERFQQADEQLFQYSVVFSNEDGGTSTRALMARWGRSTDIEYVYRAFLDAKNVRRRATIQAPGHKEVEFQGPYDGLHPLLTPVTDNNMFAGQSQAPMRYQIAPQMVILDGHSREVVMDDNPLTYRIMAAELEREGKLRPYGTVDGEKISDPRNYLYLAAKVANEGSRIAAIVRLDGSSRWRASHLGRPGYAIERSGWVRTAIELPPGTRADQVGEIGFECLTAEKSPAGVCRVEAVGKAFFLDSEYRPGPSVWRLDQPQEIPTGETVTWTLK